MVAQGVDQADGDRLRQAVADIHPRAAAAAAEDGVKFVDERLRDAVAPHIDVADVRKIRLRERLFAQQLAVHGGHAREDVRLPAHDLRGAHLRVEADAHDVGAAHEHTHVHIDAQSEPVEDGQDVVQRRVAVDRLAQKLLRLRAQAVEHGVVVRDDLGLARGAAAGEVDGRRARSELRRRAAGIFAVFEVLFKRFAEGGALLREAVVELARPAHIIRAVADEGGDAEVRPAAAVDVVHERELAARAPHALAQRFGRDEGMHEVDRRAQLVRRVKTKQRRRGVGDAQGDRVPLPDRKFGGEVVRERVDQAEHFVEGILFPIKGDGGAHGAAGNVVQQRLVHRTVFGE